MHLAMSPSWDKVSAIALDFYNQIPDLLLLQSAYRFHESLNYPLWQLSALVIAGFALCLIYVVDAGYNPFLYFRF